MDNKKVFCICNILLFIFGGILFADTRNYYVVESYQIGYEEGKAPFSYEAYEENIAFQYSHAFLTIGDNSSWLKIELYKSINEDPIEIFLFENLFGGRESLHYSKISYTGGNIDFIMSNATMEYYYYKGVFKIYGEGIERVYICLAMLDGGR